MTLGPMYSGTWTLREIQHTKTNMNEDKQQTALNLTPNNKAASGPAQSGSFLKIMGYTNTTLLPSNSPQIASNKAHNPANRGTLGGQGTECSPSRKPKAYNITYMMYSIYIYLYITILYYIIYSLYIYIYITILYHIYI